MYFWSLLMAFSLYSRIPIPGASDPAFPWERAKKDWVLCFFPLVGLVIGGAEVLLLYLSEAAGLPTTAVALFGAALPILMTGGIHLDGLVDAADARASFLPEREKLRIMKDPHVGGFGIIRLCLYFLVLLGALVAFLEESRGAWMEYAPGIVLAFGLSRAAVGLSSLRIPRAREDGMLAAVVGQGGGGPTAVLTAELVLLFAALFCWRGSCAAAFAIVAVLLFWYYRGMALRQFGGVTGDLAGWFLCVLELAMALVLAGLPYLHRLAA